MPKHYSYSTYRYLLIGLSSHLIISSITCVGGSTEEAQSSIGIEVGSALVKFINTGSTLGAVNFPEVDIRYFTLGFAHLKI